MANLQYNDAGVSPARYQWEASSGTPWASQSNNCGPTCATKIADFYNNTRYGIESTRYLVVGCCVPTTCTQQAAMLTLRGVPSIPVWINSLGEIDAVVGWDGNHPIIIGMEMSRVPYDIKDHPFDGWHAVVVLKRVERNGVSGYLIMDPNFSPTGGNRPDPDGGKKFYPRWVLDYAFIRNNIRWSVIPNRAKVTEQQGRYIVGDPIVDNKLFENELGHSITIKSGKPIRAGWSIKDKVLRVTSERTERRLIGRIYKEDLPWSEREYGAVWLVAQGVRDKKERVGYVKGVDLVDGSYK